ncbi:MAG: hypothetical protein QHH06_08220 [Clostridiales bacterium]|nr:hypothetical protein [Eubacteriales bacterium]MDH7566452.1 hypothetical protein [Clostridiales bacterium]
MENKGDKLLHKLLWPAVFALIITKYAYYGYKYYPMVDDNNMYGIYRMYSNAFHDVLIQYHTYMTRPFAALLDPYLWAKFWDNLGIALFIMTVLHFFICVLVYKVFEKCGLSIGFPAIALLALLPFGSEATYWLSASTRIVVGLFFAALSFYMLCLYIESRGRAKRQAAYLVLFFLTHLVSLGFYEQVVALSFFAAIPVFAAKWKQLESKWVVVLPLINIGAVALWYKLFSHQGNLADRGQLVEGNYLAHTRQVVKAVGEVWQKSLSDLAGTSFPKGLETAVSNGSYLFLLLMGILSLAAFFISIREKRNTDSRAAVMKLLLGGYLFAVPFAPFFITSIVWICNRNLFPSFIGLGLMLEAVLDLIPRNKALTFIKGSAVGFLVFIFLAANIYELTYYRSIGLMDREITSGIARTPAASDYLNGKKPLILFNAKASYIDSTAKRIGNCTGADWSLTGAIRAHNSLRKLQYAYPVPAGTEMPLAEDLPKSSILLGMDDSRNIFPVKIAGEGDRKLYISRMDGSKYGEIEQLGNNYIKFHLSP